MNEIEIQRDIITRLERLGYLVWRNNNIPTRHRRNTASASKGMPDLFIIVAGILVGIEVKVPGGKVRKEQLEWGDKLQKAGASFCVATSFEDVAYHIRTL